MERDKAVEYLGQDVIYEQGCYRYARGTVIGIVDRPSVVIEDPMGHRFVFALDTVTVHGRADSETYLRALGVQRP